MRLYVPDSTRCKDGTDFILGIRHSDNHRVNQALLDELLNDDNMIFFDAETDRFSPLKTSDDRYQYTDYVLYNLLTLDFKDGDNKNKKFDNLQLVCANCYFNNVGNFPSAKKFCK